MDSPEVLAAWKTTVADFSSKALAGDLLGAAGVDETQVVSISLPSDVERVGSLTVAAPGLVWRSVLGRDAHVGDMVIPRVPGADAVDRALEEARKLLTAPDGVFDTYTYDALGHLTEQKRAAGTAVESITRHTYANNRCTHTYDAYGTPEEAHTSYTYDNKDRLASTTQHMVGTLADRLTSHLRESGGRITQTTHPDGSRENWTYDENSNILIHIDLGGMVTATTYDEFDRVLTQTVVFGTAEALTSTWTYAHTNGGGSSCGSCSNSNTPATMTTPDGVVTKYEYDLEWRLYKTTVGYGTNLAQVTEHDLDIHGRVTRTIAPDGAQTLYTYEDPTFADAHHPTTPPLVEGTGGLKTTTDPLGRVIENHYYMDSLQLIRRVETPDAPGANTGLRVTEYTYADVAQGYEPESTTVYPGEADQIQQTIDTAGRVTKTTHTANGIGTLVAKTTYDAKGRVVERQYKSRCRARKNLHLHLRQHRTPNHHDLARQHRRNHRLRQRGTNRQQNQPLRSHANPLLR